MIKPSTNGDAARCVPRRNARLTVVPQGGLCNRMRVVQSALGVAMRSGYPVCVAWSRNAECACNFDEVFAPIVPTVPPADVHFSLRRAHFCDLPAARRNLHLPALLRVPFYRAQRSNYNGSSPDDILSLLRREGSVYISTCYEFFDDTPNAAQLFRPSRKVAELVSRLTSEFDAYTVGMHIRTGDNEQARLHSPLSLFIAKAHEELERDPRTRIFLSTDSCEAKAQFAARFPRRIITGSGELSRTTPDGMLTAAADLFTLAQTARIYGSYYSSFSATAAEIGEKPLTILS